MLLEAAHPAERSHRWPELSRVVKAGLLQSGKLLLEW